MCLLLSFGAEKKVKSTIKGVTVFLSGAKVMRSGSFIVPKGKTEIVFTQILPLLRSESLQAGSKSDITILSVYYETKVRKKEQDKGELKDKGKRIFSPDEFFVIISKGLCRNKKRTSFNLIVEDQFPTVFECQS